MLTQHNNHAALNNAIQALREAALRHDDDGVRSETPELQILLDGLAARRDAAAKAILSAWDDAPQATRAGGPDAVALNDAFSRVGTAIAADTDGVLAGECLTLETRAFNAVETARNHDNPEKLASALEAARDDIAQAMNALQPFLAEET
jgi:hypothetical protein